MTVKFTGEIHPFADAFPMLSFDDDLAALAQSIKVDGLQHPLVLSPDGVLLDGRNRLAACELAGVEPKFVVHDGDPVALIVAQNMQRRHLNTGQRAILGARARLLQCNNQRQEDAAALVGVSRARIAQAETILRHASELADQVMANLIPFVDAYQLARASKTGTGDKQKRMDRLRKQAPDIAAAVDDEILTLDEAIGALDARIGNARSAARHLRSDITELTELGPRLKTTPLDGTLALAYANREHPPTLDEIDEARAQLDRAAAALDDIARHLKEIDDA